MTSILLAMLLLTLIFTVVYADYVGTGSVQISLDPASAPVIADGYQVGDIVSFILTQAPKDTGSVDGMNAYGTLYVPAGVEVVGADLVELLGGSYNAVPAEDVAPGPDGCGNRGCYNSGAFAAPNGSGKINEVQQDTGIFYSTDPRTALVVGGYGTIDPTGGVDKPQTVYNQWDYNQVEAFGAANGEALGGANALSGNTGKGATPVISTTSGYSGTGAPTAGVDSYYTNDYNPVCDGNAGVFSLADFLCIGPWQRIEYPNDKIGGSGPIMPTTADPGPRLNTAVAASGGHALSPANALPANTKALRYVHGIRTVGDIELARVTFRITNVTSFTNSFLNNTFCLDGTGGDHNKDMDQVDGRGPQDNMWRYYEGNNHSCFTGGALIKVPEFVDGLAAGSDVTPTAVIGYEITFFNTTAQTLFDVVLTDQPLTSNLTLVAASTTGCPYANYNGDQAGLPTINTLVGTQATWNELASLAAGASVTVHMCAQVASNVVDGEEVRNEACVDYNDVNDDANTNVHACAATLQLVDSTPTAIRLNSLEARPAPGMALWVAALVASLLAAALLLRRLAAARI